MKSIRLPKSSAGATAPQNSNTAAPALTPVPGSTDGSTLRGANSPCRRTQPRRILVTAAALAFAAIAPVSGPFVSALRADEPTATIGKGELKTPGELYSEGWNMKFSEFAILGTAGSPSVLRFTNNGSSLIGTLSYQNTWAGTTANNHWDFVATTFIGATSSGTGPRAFANGDTVLFNDSAANKTVLIPSDMAPANVTVDATGNYTFENTSSGMGSISATGTLTKSGTGKLTLNNLPANFANGIALRNGTLALDTSELRTTAYLDIAAQSTLQLGSGGTGGSQGRVIADTLTNNGSITGSGRIRALQFTNAAGGVLSPGGDGVIGTLEIEAAAFSNLGTIRIDLNTTGHDVIRNHAETPLALHGQIELHPEVSFFAGAENQVGTGQVITLPGFLESAEGAGEISLAEDADVQVGLTLPSLWFFEAINLQTGSVSFSTPNFGDLSPERIPGTFTSAVLNRLASVSQGRLLAAIQDSEKLQNTLRTPLGFSAITALPIAEHHATAELLSHHANSASNFWVSAQGHFSKHNADASSPFFDRRAAGSLGIGYDFETESNHSIGLHLNGALGTAKFHESTGEVKTAGGLASIYGNFADRKTGLSLAWSASAGYTQYDVKMRNWFSQEASQGETDGVLFGASATLGRSFSVIDSFSAFPFISLDFSHVQADKFETDKEMSLEVGKISQNSLLGRLGVGISWHPNTSFFWGLSVAYERELLNNEVNIRLKLRGNDQSYDISAVTGSKGYATVTPSLGVRLSRNTRIAFLYKLGIGDAGNTHDITLTFNKSF